MPRIDSFLAQRGEKVKWSARLQEISFKKKGAFSSKIKEEYHEKIFLVGKTRCFSFKPGSKVSFKLKDKHHYSIISFFKKIWIEFSTQIRK